ncbi:hypothetical protein ANO14919_108480 [Xylariales sp. No.14919]|nr:hypothetical protein ANO14919_108480 [Xylariales sp. No.14919]
MERKRLFWVPVRDYRLLHTKSLVQSPHINLEAKVPRVIIRAIDGEYVGEPRVIDDAAALADDINGKIYSHAAHGVCVSLESHADGFPVWVCLKRNEHCQENHVWVLNLFNSEFLVVPIANICWVPSHEAADGGLYTIIGDPGKHGYQGSYLPAVTQELDLPRRAKLCLLPTDLPGFKRLEARRQQELFDRQYLNMKKDSEKCPKPDRLSLQCLRQPEQQQQPHAAVHGISKLPAFCEDPYSDEERASPLPLNQIGGIQGPVPEAGSLGCSHVLMKNLTLISRIGLLPMLFWPLPRSWSDLPRPYTTTSTHHGGSVQSRLNAYSPLRICGPQA